MGLTDIDKVLYMAIITYILAMLLLIITRPSFLYDEQTNKSKNYGSGDNESLIAFPITGTILCVFIYLFTTIYILVISKLK